MGNRAHQLRGQKSSDKANQNHGVAVRVQKMRLARKAVAVSMDVARIKTIIQEMHAKAHEDT